MNIRMMEITRESSARKDQQYSDRDHIGRGTRQTNPAMAMARTTVDENGFSTPQGNKKISLYEQGNRYTQQMDKYENTNMMLMEPRGANSSLPGTEHRSKTEYNGSKNGGQQITHQ